jgi:hypothetical protein
MTSELCEAIMSGRINQEMKKLNLVLILLITSLVSGCASTVNMKNYRASMPSNIGVVIGHEISALSELSTGKIIFYGLLGGAIGTTIASLNTDKWRVDIEGEIVDSLWSNTQTKMISKNYQMSLVNTTSKKWKLFENITDSKNVYSNLIQKYELSNSANNYDAILFVEVLIEGRIKGEDRPEDINMDNFRMMFAKSKLFLYDTKSQKRIYHKMIQKGYSSWSKAKLYEELDNLIEFKAIPEKANLNTTF